MVLFFYWTQELLVPAEKFTVRMPFASLYISHFSTAVDFSSERYSGSILLLDAGTPGTGREIYRDDAMRGTCVQ